MPEDSIPEDVSEAAALLGRRGGLEGGIARAKKLTPERRKEIASNAAKAKWDYYRKVKAAMAK